MKVEILTGKFKHCVGEIIHLKGHSIIGTGWDYGIQFCKDGIIYGYNKDEVREVKP